MKTRALICCAAAAAVMAVPMTHSIAAGRAATQPNAQVTKAIRARLLSSGSGPGQNLSGKASSSWQTNNTVWALAPVNGDVFVGGQFTSVRPPGDPAGTGEVARTYLAEFDASTGALVTSFNPTLDGQVTALAVSPDGGTLYVGGSFTHVNGTYRGYLAAFNLSTGALTSWNPNATGSVLSIAPSPDGSTVYVGGNFGKLGGQVRTRAGAVTSSGTGTLLAWAPNLNGSVDAVAVAPDKSQVLIGG